MQIFIKLFFNEKFIVVFLVLFGVLGLMFMTTQARHQMSDHEEGFVKNAHLNLLTRTHAEVSRLSAEENLLKTENAAGNNRLWMIHLLSKNFEEKPQEIFLSSLHPKNPANEAKGFELRGLNYLNEHSEKNFYYEFDEDNKKFYYLEGIKAIPLCLQCHSNVQVGDIRGGISTVDDITSLLLEHNVIIKRFTIVATIFISILVFIFVIYRMLLKANQKMTHLNETLEEKVVERTLEFYEEKQFLQTVLDSSPHIMVVTDGRKLISTNKLFFTLSHFENLEAFSKKYDCICDLFQKHDQSGYLQEKIIEGREWPFYILKHPDIEHKVKIILDAKIYYFSVRAQMIGDTNKILVEFSDISDLEIQKTHYEHIATTDKLTGIANRFQFDTLFSYAIKNAKRNKEPLSLIMFDIDFFKKVNDQFGHDIGDITLHHFAQTLKKRLRLSDIFARWGGEEFMIILPKSNSKDALRLAEELRLAIEKEHFQEVGHITVSFGVASMKTDDNEDSFLKRVDTGLYSAKENGRNRVEYCE